MVASLSESLQEMVDMIITAKLEEMRDVLNHTLIPYLWKLNGWDMTVLPTFEFTAVRKPTLDEYSKSNSTYWCCEAYRPYS